MQDEGKIIAVKPISQDRDTQWGILLRCPFKAVHIEAILQALEEEQKASQDASPVRQGIGAGQPAQHGSCGGIQEQEQKDGTRAEEEDGGPEPGGLHEAHCSL